MGYLAGPSPNNWGILSDGTHISSLLDAGSGKKEDRRSHPLFGHVALLVMQEVHYVCLYMSLLLLYSAYDPALLYIILFYLFSFTILNFYCIYVHPYSFVDAATSILFLLSFTTMRSITSYATIPDLHIQHRNTH